MEQNSRKVMVTEPVEIIYPHIFKPDTKFKKEGTYRLTAFLEPSSDTLKIIDSIWKEELARQAVIKRGKPKITKESLPYHMDDQRDKMAVKFRQDALVIPKSGTPFEKKVAIFDSKGKPILVDPQAGNGTIARIAYEPFFWESVQGCGLSLRLKGVKILKLVKFDIDTADALGLAEEEDGYSFESQEEYEAIDPDDSGDF